MTIIHSCLLFRQPCSSCQAGASINRSVVLKQMWTSVQQTTEVVIRELGARTLTEVSYASADQDTPEMDLTAQALISYYNLFLKTPRQQHFSKTNNTNDIIILAAVQYAVSILCLLLCFKLLYVYTCIAKYGYLSHIFVETRCQKSSQTLVTWTLEWQPRLTLHHVIVFANYDSTLRRFVDSCVCVCVCACVWFAHLFTHLFINLVIKHTWLTTSNINTIRQRDHQGDTASIIVTRVTLRMCFYVNRWCMQFTKVVYANDSMA